ncbi:hypothetical protein CBL_03749 [Carabus blaptoides fortunei]
MHVFFIAFTFENVSVLCGYQRDAGRAQMKLKPSIGQNPKLNVLAHMQISSRLVCVTEHVSHEWSLSTAACVTGGAAVKHTVAAGLYDVASLFTIKREDAEEENP